MTPDYVRELYPFLHDTPATGGAGLDAIMSMAQQSTLQKCEDVVALRRQLQSEYGDLLPTAAEAMAQRFRRGGSLLAFGNGGSATDAHDAVTDCLFPQMPEWRVLPALSLVGDIATLTAIANDVGFDKVFLRQVIAFGTAADIALGFSTSGNSANVVEGLAEARRRGLLTIAVSGNEGGILGRADAADFCFIARAEHIPRIQEGQATVWHALLDQLQARLAESAEDGA